MGPYTYIIPDTWYIFRNKILKKFALIIRFFKNYQDFFRWKQMKTFVLFFDLKKMEKTRNTRARARANELEFMNFLCRIDLDIFWSMKKKIQDYLFFSSCIWFFFHNFILKKVAEVDIFEHIYNQMCNNMNIEKKNTKNKC